MSKIGFIGYGVVGRAMGETFQEADFPVIFYDVMDKGLPNQVSFEEVLDTDLLFVSVPTPTNFETEHVDLHIVDETMARIAANSNHQGVVLKCTVPPGTTETYTEKYPNISITYSPEFLVESNAKQSFLKSSRHIITGPNTLTREKLTSVLKGSTETYKFYYHPRYEVGEMIKYMANTLLATKVTIANEYYDLCEKFDIRYEDVKSGVAMDDRIGNTHLDVTTQRGFSGMCFPKDIVAIINSFDDLNVDATVLKSVWEKNKKVRKIHDWK